MPANENSVSKTLFWTVSTVLALLAASAIGLLVRQFWQGGKTQPDSPIIVRGGAMSVFTTSTNWTQSPKNGNVYCTDGDTSYLEFKRGSNQPEWNAGSSNLQWTVKLYGHDPSEAGYPAGQPYGLQLTNKVTNCAQGQLELAFIGNGQFYDYHKDHPTSSAHKDSRVFEVLDPACGRDFIDFCERMGKIDISVTPSPSAPPPTLCQDGDCTIGIGKH